MASLVQRLRQARQGRKSSQRASKRRQASRSTARGTRKFRMESLESRQLLSVAPSLPGVPSLPGAWELCSEEMTTSCYVGDLGNSSDATDIVIGGAQVDSGDSGLGTNSAPLAQDDAYSIRSNQQIGANVLANDSDADGDPLTVRLVAGAEHGQLQLADDGRFTYVPQADFEGEDTFVYQAGDGLADSAPATVRIAVAHVVVANAAPTATDDSYTVAEDGVLSIDADGVLANDVDSDGDSLAAALVAPPKYGTLILGTDGSLQYTPNDDYHGVDTFTYAADDGTSLSPEATVTIEVTAVNDAPVAGDDLYDMNEGEVLSVGDGGVLANDTDIDGDTLVATVVNGPSHGSLELNPDGSFEYTPAAGFYGDDSFTYVAGDGEVESNLATVTVSIAAVNDAPTSADDTYSVIAGETLSVAEGGVLANDSDADGDSLSAAVVAEPANGVLVLNADGSFQYTPAEGFVGDDSFTYLASDGQAESNLATVTVSVIRPNSAPVAADDAYSVIAGETVSVAEGGVLANDSDADGDSLSAAVVAEPANGVLVLNADGSFQYTPAEGFVGDDSFTYLASDGQAESNLATVTVSVIRPNSAPVAADDAYSVVAGEMVSVAEGGVLANDSDADGDSLSAAVVAEPANGVLVLNADGSFQYTPAEGFVGDDSFTYLASDGQAESNLATVTVSVIRPNSAPVAADDAYSVIAGEMVSVAEGGVLANDSDADGDSLSAAIVAEPANGVLVLNADGSFQYTPAEGFVGDDSFTYLASDGQAESNLATVTVSVIRPNSAPVAADDAYSVIAGETVSVAEGGVLANDSDADGDSLSAVVVAEPANGVLVLNADGSFQYTPADGFVGDDSFTYLASDGQAESNLATVTVSVVRPNSAPVAADDAYSVIAGETVSVAEGGVLANDSDADGDSLAAVVLTEPAHGTLVLNADGSFQYTPAEGFVGDDSFTYLASDGQAESEPAEVVIAVRQITMRIHLEVSGTAFGSQAGPIWGGSTFWVNAYVEDLRDLPQGVVGGAVDVLFDTLALTPTGNVAYGEAFSQFQQGTADDAAGVIDEAGALTTTGGIGVDAAAPFVAWQFRRDGEGAPDDANRRVTFSIAPAGGDSTILPSNFALVGQAYGADWSSVELGAAQIDLYLGDFTADGAVNHFDLAMWIPQMTAGSEASLNPLFDLDGDAAVDAADLDLLLSRMYEPVMPESPQTVASTEDIFAEDFDWADTRVSSGAQLASAPLKLNAIDSALEGEDLWRWG